MKQLIKYIFFLLVLIVLGTALVFLTPSCKRKIKIEQTVVSIKEIKDIGQLITAEYDGEVMSSLSLIDPTFNIDTFIKTNYEELHQDYEEIQTKVKEDPKVVRQDRKIKKLESKMEGASDRKKARLKKRIVKRERRKERKAKRLERKAIRKEVSRKKSPAFKALREATGKSRKKIFEDLGKSENVEDFVKKNEVKIMKFKRKQIKKKEDIAYLARGKVKAGYDLKNLDERSLFISPSKDTIYILDFNPELYPVVINPWFYFTEDPKTKKEAKSQLYGFEIIYTNTSKDTKITFNRVQEIKSDCKRMLREEALDRDIYEAARQNAEEVLLSFFQLLTLDAEVQPQKVVISPSKYFFDQVEILRDEMIDSTEMVLIDTILRRDTRHMDSLAFPHQDMDYQMQVLESFMLALHEGSKQELNCEAWKKRINEYADRRNLSLKSAL